MRWEKRFCSLRDRSSGTAEAWPRRYPFFLPINRMATPMPMSRPSSIQGWPTAHWIPSFIVSMPAKLAHLLRLLKLLRGMGQRPMFNRSRATCPMSWCTSNPARRAELPNTSRSQLPCRGRRSCTGNRREAMRSVGHALHSRHERQVLRIFMGRFK